MAIDWGRMARGIGTGYLSAKIANTEANDKLNARIIEGAGLNFINNTLPEHQKRERIREETYTKISTVYSPEVAQYLDHNGMITGNANDYKNIRTQLGEPGSVNESQLKAYLEGAEVGTYEERKAKRTKLLQDREKTIMGLTSGSSKIGHLTAELLIDKQDTATDADAVPETTTEQVTIPGEMVPGTPIKKMDTVETKEVPVKSEETKLPSFEEIFGDTKSSRVYTKMKREDQVAWKKVANTEFNSNFEDKLTGQVKVPKIYKDDYLKLSKAEQEKTTVEAYARERYFREVFLPNQNISYAPQEPEDVKKARQAINYNNSIGNTAGADEARRILKSLGYEPADYGL